MADRLGLAERPWVAVRTSPSTVVLLTDAAHGPLHRDAAFEYARAATVHYRLQDRRAAASEPAISTAETSADVGDAASAPSPQDVAQLSFAEPAAAVDAAPAAARESTSAPAIQPTSHPRAR